MPRAFRSAGSDVVPVVVAVRATCDSNSNRSASGGVAGREQRTRNRPLSRSGTSCARNARPRLWRRLLRCADLLNGRAPARCDVGRTCSRTTIRGRQGVPGRFVSAEESKVARSRPRQPCLRTSDPNPLSRPPRVTGILRRFRLVLRWRKKFQRQRDLTPVWFARVPLRGNRVPRDARRSGRSTRDRENDTEFTCAVRPLRLA